MNNLRSTTLAILLVINLVMTGCAGNVAEPSEEYVKFTKDINSALNQGLHAFDGIDEFTPVSEWSVTKVENGYALSVTPVNAPPVENKMDYVEMPKLIISCSPSGIMSFVSYYQYKKKYISDNVVLVNGNVHRANENKALIQVWVMNVDGVRLINKPVLGVQSRGVKKSQESRFIYVGGENVETIHDVALGGATAIAFLEPIAIADGNWWGKLVFDLRGLTSIFNKTCY